jgi:hypothetical protein
MVLFIAPLTSNLYSQSLKLGGQLGYGIPKGDIFLSGDEKLSKGGISLDLDAMYYMEKFESKLGFGINYNGSLLFGQASSSGLDIGIYGLSLYGIKVNYQIFKTKVTPYVSLSTGLAQLSTPEIKDGNNNILSKSEKSYSLGLRPEIGLDLAGFMISMGYIVPMKYDLNNKKAGVLQISLGFRYKTF